MREREIEFYLFRLYVHPTGWMVRVCEIQNFGGSFTGWHLLGLSHDHDGWLFSWFTGA